MYFAGCGACLFLLKEGVRRRGNFLPRAAEAFEGPRRPHAVPKRHMLGKLKPALDISRCSFVIAGCASPKGACYTAEGPL